ncbi:MAG: hypothetical protein WA901_07500, partial [Phormidesmis sp.]
MTLSLGTNSRSTCNCLEDISVTQLLFGLHYTTQNTVITKLNQLQSSSDSLQTSVEQGFTELRELVQRDLLRAIRVAQITQKQIASPCPSVFVLRPDDRHFWQKNITAQLVNLQLYCEHPGCLHPVISGGLYTIDNPKRWFQVMSPHLKHIFSILKYVTPVVGPWVNVADADYGELIKNELALTEA